MGTRPRDAFFPERQDGCYMVAMHNGDEWRVAADFKGYCKIFIYETGNRWAFSNSFSDLIDTVRGLGWKVTPNESQIDFWSPTPTFWQQLPTFQTAAVEVKLLPSRMSLRASQATGLTFKINVKSERHEGLESYTNSFRHYLETWIARFLSVLEDDQYQLELELTGGRDSRTALALALGAKQRVRANIGNRITVRSSQAQVHDLEIAQAISEQFGLRFNLPLTSLGQPQVRLKTLTRWEKFGLGSYGPVSLPPASIRAGVIKVGGHGGEGHRSYYTYKSLESPVLRHPELRSERVRQELLDAMEDTEESLAVTYPGVDPLVAHYKEFRDRIHGGLHAMHQVRLQPLGSYLLEHTMEFAEEEARLNGQILFDIMSAIVPSLVMMPFETKQKAPTRDILENLVRPLELDIQPGKIFRGLQVPVTGDDGWEGLQAWLVEAEAGLPQDALSKEIRMEALQIAAMLRRGGKAKHPRDLTPVHQLLLAKLVSG